MNLEVCFTFILKKSAACLLTEVYHNKLRCVTCLAYIYNADEPTLCCNVRHFLVIALQQNFYILLLPELQRQNG